MDPLLFGAFAVGYIALFVWGVAMARRHDLFLPSNVIPLVIVALIYDNVILAVGHLIGEGTLLETLHGARFWLHAFLTPLLVIFAIDAMGRAGLMVIRQRWVAFVAFVIYAALVIIDLTNEVFGLVLEPVREYGTLTYTSVEPATGPPPMIIGVTLVLLVSAVVVFWKQRWPWYLAAVILMGIGGSASLPIESAAITNLFEFILMTTLLFTKRFQDQVDDGAVETNLAARSHHVAAAPGR